MKNLSKIRLVIASLLVLSAIVFGFTPGNSTDKITICHVPPGNPDNCHEITVSRNALQAHLDHGDDLVCHSASDIKEYEKIVEVYNASLPVQQISVVRAY